MARCEEEGKERWKLVRALARNARFPRRARSVKRSWVGGEIEEVVVEALRSRFEIAAKRRGSEVTRRDKRGESGNWRLCLPRKRQ